VSGSLTVLAVARQLLPLEDLAAAVAKNPGIALLEKQQITPHVSHNLKIYF